VCHYGGKEEQVTSDRHYTTKAPDSYRLIHQL
jgi:hypothetical protein